MIARTLEETRQIAHQFAQLKIPVLALLGELGAGKTTFAKYYGEALGVKEEILSPTFSLVREYETPEGPFYHCDLYRIEDPEELQALGFEEYFQENARLLIEWPQVAQDYLQEAVYLEIRADEEGNRHFERRQG